MAYSTVFIDSEPQNNSLLLSKEKYHHLKDVLRLKSGYNLRLVLPNKAMYFAKIKNFKPEKLELETIKKEVLTTPVVSITLIQALPKADKMSGIINSCSQLGIAAIQPVISQLCDVKECSENKAKRWEKCMLSAAEQAHLDHLPKIYPSQKLAYYLEKLPHFDQKIICWENASPSQAILKQVPLKLGQSIAILIGPEGGFSAEEVAACEAKGFNTAYLCPSILRTENAGFAAIAMIWGQMAKESSIHPPQ